MKKKKQDKYSKVSEHKLQHAVGIIYNRNVH